MPGQAPIKWARTKVTKDKVSSYSVLRQIFFAYYLPKSKF